MEMNIIIAVLRESLALIFVIVALLMYAIIRGRNALISVILGLYIALLISITFPYYEALYALTESTESDPLLNILLFLVFTVAGSILFERLLPDDRDEGAMEGIGGKTILALLGAALVMAYSYHVLPITTLIDPGTPVSMLFAPEGHFFWWLIAPLVILFFI